MTKPAPHHRYNDFQKLVLLRRSIPNRTLSYSGEKIPELNCMADDTFWKATAEYSG